jgi:hypothetical protein
MKKIVIERKKGINPQCQISLTQEAADCLLEVIRETGLSTKAAASTIIVQAVRNDMIIYQDQEEQIE